MLRPSRRDPVRALLSSLGLFWRLKGAALSPFLFLSVVGDVLVGEITVFELREFFHQLLLKGSYLFRKGFHELRCRKGVPPKSFLQELEAFGFRQVRSPVIYKERVFLIDALTGIVIPDKNAFDAPNFLKESKRKINPPIYFPLTKERRL